jgi:hypothetical protein
MSDTDTPQEQTEQPARKRGRSPKLKRLVGRGPLRQPLHESARDEGFVYQPFENIIPLHIDTEILRSIEFDYGFRLQWCVESVLGQPQDEVMSAHRKNKFQEVRKRSFGGLLDYLCDREGRIVKGGLVLMGRPAEIDDMARTHERKTARRQIEDMQKRHSDEGLPVPGGREAAAREHNRHRSSFERVEIPER